jgi:hypothetical protein
MQCVGFRDWGLRIWFMEYRISDSQFRIQELELRGTGEASRV